MASSQGTESTETESKTAEVTENKPKEASSSQGTESTETESKTAEVTENKTREVASSQGTESTETESKTAEVTENKTREVVSSQGTESTETESKKTEVSSSSESRESSSSQGIEKVNSLLSEVSDKNVLDSYAQQGRATSNEVFETAEQKSDSVTNKDVASQTAVDKQRESLNSTTTSSSSSYFGKTIGEIIEEKNQLAKASSSSSSEVSSQETESVAVENDKESSSQEAELKEDPSIRKARIALESQSQANKTATSSSPELSSQETQSVAVENDKESSSQEATPKEDGSISRATRALESQSQANKTVASSSPELSSQGTEDVAKETNSQESKVAENSSTELSEEVRESSKKLLDTNKASVSQETTTESATQEVAKESAVESQKSGTIQLASLSEDAVKKDAVPVGEKSEVITIPNIWDNKEGSSSVEVAEKSVSTETTSSTENSNKENSVASSEKEVTGQDPWERYYSQKKETSQTTTEVQKTETSETSSTSQTEEKTDKNTTREVATNFIFGNNSPNRGSSDSSQQTETVETEKSATTEVASSTEETTKREGSQETEKSATTEVANSTEETTKREGSQETEKSATAEVANSTEETTKREGSQETNTEKSGTTEVASSTEEASKREGSQETNTEKSGTTEVANSTEETTKREGSQETEKSATTEVANSTEETSKREGSQETEKSATTEVASSTEETSKKEGSSSVEVAERSGSSETAKDNVANQEIIFELSEVKKLEEARNLEEASKSNLKALELIIASKAHPSLNALEVMAEIDKDSELKELKEQVFENRDRLTLARQAEMGHKLFEAGNLKLALSQFRTVLKAMEVSQESEFRLTIPNVAGADQERITIEKYRVPVEEAIRKIEAHESVAKGIKQVFEGELLEARVEFNQAIEKLAGFSDEFSNNVKKSAQEGLAKVQSSQDSVAKQQKALKNFKISEITLEIERAEEMTNQERLLEAENHYSEAEKILDSLKEFKVSPTPEQQKSSTNPTFVAFDNTLTEDEKNILEEFRKSLQEGQKRLTLLQALDRAKGYYQTGVFKEAVALYEEVLNQIKGQEEVFEKEYNQALRGFKRAESSFLNKDAQLQYEARNFREAHKGFHEARAIASGYTGDQELDKQAEVAEEGLERTRAYAAALVEKAKTYIVTGNRFKKRKGVVLLMEAMDYFNSQEAKELFSSYETQAFVGKVITKYNKNKNKPKFMQNNLLIVQKEMKNFEKAPNFLQRAASKCASVFKPAPKPSPTKEVVSSL